MDLRPAAEAPRAESRRGGRWWPEWRSGMRGEFYREASVGEKSARRSGWSARDRACWRKRKPTAPVRNTKPPTRRATQIGKKGAVGGVCVTATGDLVLLVLRRWRQPLCPQRTEVLLRGRPHDAVVVHRGQGTRSADGRVGMDGRVRARGCPCEHLNLYRPAQSAIGRIFFQQLGLSKFNSSSVNF